MHWAPAENFDILVLTQAGLMLTHVWQQRQENEIYITRTNWCIDLKLLNLIGPPGTENFKSDKRLFPMS